MMVVEEKLLSGTQLDPMYVVGMEGFWGCLFFGILLPIFQTIHCTGSLCHEGKLEDTIATFREMRENPIIFY
jgi:pentatricopeptide repeat protein